jgi:hypothetical protein
LYFVIKFTIMLAILVAAVIGLGPVELLAQAPVGSIPPNQTPPAEQSIPGEESSPPDEDSLDASPVPPTPCPTCDDTGDQIGATITPSGQHMTPTSQMPTALTPVASSFTDLPNKPEEHGDYGWIGLFGLLGLVGLLRKRQDNR